MFKIWAKTLKGDKIKTSFVYENPGKFESSDFFKYVVEICEKIDIPVPVILGSHIDRFVRFNNARFAPGDFVDAVPFTRFVLENVPL